MNTDLEAFIDKQRIHEVLSTYCRGVDRCDAALVRSVYHPDSYDDHGYWKGPGHEFADFVVDRLWRANSATMHTIANVLIDLPEPGIAISEAHVHVTLIRRGSGETVADVMGARYIDRLSKRDNDWKIDERTVVLEWTKVETWPVSDPAIPLDNFTWGQRGDTRDAVYEMLERRTLQSTIPVTEGHR
ncbi:MULTISPECIES: nuclear transport factor 2 family protein [Novosphingobium]|uniref:nuclear transport factor 2 family protein n=1 Tax=Novosphingobium TaxID=165696 RepID=UPI0022F29755|nr:nuclear transport factor 2 family protein [Novosphingobium resinovorum]GLK46048.1 hypothetical protein GCM10017612_39680 [Novosphingobium resinovorum]